MASTLGPRGMRLWNAYIELVDERGVVLLEEACRIADRLDRLEALLAGEAETWVRIVERHGAPPELVIDNELSEARQQAMALRQLLTSLPMKEAKPDDGDADDWLDGLHAEVLHAEGRSVPDVGAAGRGGRKAPG